MFLPPPRDYPPARPAQPFSTTFFRPRTANRPGSQRPRRPARGHACPQPHAPGMAASAVLTGWIIRTLRRTRMSALRPLTRRLRPLPKSRRPFPKSRPPQTIFPRPFPKARQTQTNFPRPFPCGRRPQTNSPRSFPCGRRPQTNSPRSFPCGRRPQTNSPRSFPCGRRPLTIGRRFFPKERRSLTIFRQKRVSPPPENPPKPQQTPHFPQKRPFPPRLLITGHWSLITGHWSLITDSCLSRPSGRETLVEPLPKSRPALRQPGAARATPASQRALEFPLQSPAIG